MTDNADPECLMMICGCAAAVRLGHGVITYTPFASNPEQYSLRRKDCDRNGVVIIKKAAHGSNKSKTTNAQRSGFAYWQERDTVMTHESSHAR